MNKFKRTFGFIFSHPLGKKHPLSCLARLITWQIQSGILPRKLWVKNFVYPVKFYARKGLTGVTGNIYTGLHEFNDMAFLLHLLRAGDVFFDIGANVGSYTLLAAGVCGVKTVAVEPAKSTFDLLYKNISLNKLQSNIIPVNAGAGAAKGTVSFSVTEDTTNHVISANETGNLDTIAAVPIISVDSLLIYGTPALIKIDVEGYETEVLKGMEDVLSSAVLKAIIIELNGSGGRYGFNDDDIHRLLISKNFRPYSYDPYLRNLSKLPGFTKANNTIYCRQVDEVKQRLKNAEKIKVLGSIL